MQCNTTLGLVGFCTGAISSRWWPMLPNSLAMVILALLLFTVMIMLIKAKIYTDIRGIPLPFAGSGYQAQALSLLFGFIVGIIWMASVWHWLLHWQLPSDKIQRDVTIIGQITVHTHTHKVDNYTIAVTQLDNHHYQPAINVRVNAYQLTQRFLTGQRVMLKVKLRRPHSPLNPGGWDFRQSALSQGLSATGYIKPDANNRVLTVSNSWRQRWLDNLKQHKVPGLKWILALGYGDRSALTSEDWRVLQHSGLAHVMSISGLHVGVVAVWVIYLCRVMTFGLRCLFSKPVDLRGLTGGTLLLVTVLFTYLAGAQIPVVRAWLLLLLSTLVFHASSYWAIRHLCLWMVTLCLVLFPFSVLGVSFWLSVSAVCVIWLIHWRFGLPFQTFKDKLKSALKLQLCLSLAMVPLTAAQFGLVSVLSVVLNLFVTPLIALVLVPCILLGNGIFWLFDSVRLLVWSGWTIESLMSLVQVCVSDTWQGIDVQFLPVEVWWLIGVILLIVIMPKFYFKTLALAVLMGSVASHLITWPPAKWQFHVFDVGQGSAFLLTYGRKGIVIDTGASFYQGGSAAERYILPAMDRLGVENLDSIYVSHFDNDHYGGVEAITRAYPHADVITPEKDCIAGYSRTWEGIHLQALWPLTPNKKPKNNASCVLLVTIAGYRILIPGDIEAVSERALIAMHTELKADILVAPHHGSKSSSTPAFIRAVDPEWVVFTQAYQHRWNFPHPEVLARYHNNNIKPLLTSYHGYLRFDFEKLELPHIYTMRNAPATPWFQRPLAHRSDIGDSLHSAKSAVIE